VDTPSEISRFETARQAAGIRGGILVANPVPAENEIARDEMEGYIRIALQAASDQKIAAKAVTPFLLDHIFHQTRGRSLKTNIALVENNARLAAEIAVSLASDHTRR
ncbi:MAG TPA: pseudouridine-5'-phosphate glycosidase, partial [Pseudorhizobium sp.]|nr:pseudouridine-5'-phosphate glycosidase [Pseudorhizobium sp.]